MSKCPDCNGTGEYVGLNKVEPCKTCSELRPLPEQFGTRYYPAGYVETTTEQWSLAEQMASFGEWVRCHTDRNGTPMVNSAGERLKDVYIYVQTLGPRSIQGR